MRANLPVPSERSSMSRIAALGALAALGFAAPAPVRAQICAGQASFGPYALHVSGSAEFGNNARSFGGGIGIGGRRLFGGTGVTRTTYDSLEGRTITVSAEGGYQVPLDRKGVFHLCVIGTGAIGMGPDDVGIGFGSTGDLGETDFALGTSVGAQVSRSPKSRMIPSVAFSVVKAMARIKYNSGARVSQTQVYERLGLAFGFVFNERVSVLPGVSIPMGLGGASTTFHLTLSVNAKRRAK